ncbi:hypothetical protein [Streptomyces sp. HPF1205]|uniref:hypothetical protein n=1 Tax=Streptomyces sp. HPF1205 TaxID=2873262 RepID=UPI001CEDA69F|nr:hypothetical protein [Streptomyces sp. HPF1205]
MPSVLPHHLLAAGVGIAVQCLAVVLPFAAGAWTAAMRSPGTRRRAGPAGWVLAVALYLLALAVAYVAA